MIQSNPPRAEARRQARERASDHAYAMRELSAPLADLSLPNRAQRRARPAEAGTGESPTSNRSNAPRRAARITQRRRAIRAARRHTR